uniref:WAT1-related protein n=1 Tax=Hordeum vulgare subsp. vulgare TaxID=112509 RepID=A0A8I6WM02_HORVV
MVGGGKKSYVVAVAIQALYAGLFIISKAAFDSGINTYVFIFYRLTAATALLLPTALINNTCRRSRSTASTPPPAMSCRLLLKLFLCALLGNTFTLNVYNVSLKQTSATVGTAASNSMPVITFLLALVLKMETIKLRSRSGLGKLVGIMICLAGVLVIAFYIGPSIHPLAHHPVFAHKLQRINNGEWIRATFLLILACTTWSFWIALQVPILKEYPNKLMATAMQCLFGALQSFVVAAVAERDFQKWKLGLDIGLLAVLYSAFLGTGALMYLQAWCAEMSGPVFVVMWNPLALVFTIFCSLFFLGEIVHLGSILGGALLVGGLYMVLWGKSNEEENKMLSVMPEESQVQGEGTITQDKHEEEELTSQV